MSGLHCVADAKTLSNWQARLALEFCVKSQKTVLSRREHEGPLAFQKVLYPEGERIAHALLVHPPGGIAGGDRLAIGMKLKDGAHVLATTPGATKWYRSNGQQAKQDISVIQGPGSLLEYLPQENILFNASDAQNHIEVHLDDDAVFAGWDITALGRRARGESWNSGTWGQVIRVFQAGRVRFQERLNVAADDLRTRSKIGFSNQPVFGSFFVVGRRPAAELVAACQALSPEPPGVAGVSALEWGMAVRYLGESPEQARSYFEHIWSLLRPWYANTEMRRPRIWAT